MKENQKKLIMFVVEDTQMDIVAEVVKDGKLQDTVQVVAEDTISIGEKEMNWVNSRMRKWALPQEEKVVSGAGTPETMKETT